MNSSSMLRNEHLWLDMCRKAVWLELGIDAFCFLWCLEGRRWGEADAPDCYGIGGSGVVVGKPNAAQPKTGEMGDQPSGQALPGRA